MFIVRKIFIKECQAKTLTPIIIFISFDIFLWLHTTIYITYEFLNLMFIGPCIIVIVEEWKTNLLSLAILFHFLCTQHVSDINISIMRSLRLCCWITISVVLFSVRCVLEIWCGWVWVVPVLQAVLMSETCWVHKKWNKIASDIKLVFYSSVITMMHGPMNVRFL